MLLNRFIFLSLILSLPPPPFFFLQFRLFLSLSVCVVSVSVSVFHSVCRHRLYLFLCLSRCIYQIFLAHSILLFLSPPPSLSLCRLVSFLFLSPCLSNYVPAAPPSIFFSLCRLISVCLSLSICLSVCLPVYVCLSACLSLSLSLSLSFHKKDDCLPLTLRMTTFYPPPGWEIATSKTRRSEKKNHSILISFNGIVVGNTK